MIVFAAAVFVASQSYSRKETAAGVLRPALGEVRVRATQGGSVRAVYVSEGQIVERGEPLAHLGTERTREDGALAFDAVLRGLADEETALRGRLDALDAAQPLEIAALTAEIREVEADLAGARAALPSIRARHVLAVERADAGRTLEARGFMPGEGMREREDLVLRLDEEISAMIGRIAALSARRDRLNAQRALLPQDARQNREAIEGQLAAITQRRAELEAERGYTLSAPIRGRVTAVQAVVGQAADPNAPLMTLTPEDAALTAELYVSSRAIGFVAPGQPVRLLYDAFPYERFGPAWGEVEHIANTVLMPGEVTAAVMVEEPVYRVLVALERDTIDAFGRETPLQPGMALSADIILEKRTFAEWLLEPVLAARGRL